MGATQKSWVQSCIRARANKSKVDEEKEEEDEEEKERGLMSGTRSDGYYLECRKDAQCVCRMCKESMTATIDLRQRSSGVSMVADAMDGSFASDKENQPWPPPFPSHFSPYGARLSRRKAYRSNPSASSSSSPFSAEDESGETIGGFRLLLHRKIFSPSSIFLIFLFFCPIFIAPLAISYLSKPHFNTRSFALLAHGSLERIRLADRLDFVQRHISRRARASSTSSSSSFFSVSNCSGSTSSSWKLAQDDYFIHSSCDMYDSLVEKVSVWGYAMKTGGILGRSLVDRSFTVLAGRVLEWPEGGVEYIVHKEGDSWTMKRWAASTILLDGNTWVLEYKRKPVYEGFGGFQGFLYLATSGLRVAWRNIKLISDTAFIVHHVFSDVFPGTEAGIPCPT